ncbi:MAG: hypothetical protein ACFFA0_02245 [Promethearchaeota archaeon]
MAIGKKKIILLLNEFPKHEVLYGIEDKIKNEIFFCQSLETNLDPVQMQRNEKNWKQTVGFYHLHPEKFKFGLKHLN